MRFKGTGLLAVLFVAALAWVYFYEIRGGRERQAAEEAEKKVFVFSPDDISGIWLQNREGTVRMARTDDGWEIREPIVTGGDESQIDLILTSLESARIERVVTDSAVDLTAFGLDEPEVLIRLESEEAGFDTLQIGRHNPTMEFVYARLSGADRVFLIPATVYNNANKKLFVLRDKSLLHFRREDVRRLTLEREDARYVFEREDEGWRIVEPIEARADKGKVERVINALKNVKTKRFVSEGGEDLVEWGLDPPRSFCEVLLGEELAMKRLILGEITGSGDAYGKDLSRDPVFVVPSQIIGYINEEIEAYRDRTILAFDRQDVTGVTIVYPDSTFRCEKDSTGDWHLYAGDDPLRIAADGPAVDRLVSSLYTLRAESFVGVKGESLAPYGLDAPQLTLRLEGLPDGPASLIVGRREKEEKDEGSPHEFAYLAVEGDDWVYTARWTLVERLFVGLDDLRAEAEEADLGGEE
jgi:hypothetical protein